MKTKKKVLWTGDSGSTMVDWITDHLRLIRDSQCDYEVITLREASVLRETANYDLSVNIINDQLRMITEFAEDNHCDMIVFPIWAKLTELFFIELPRGIDVLMLNTCTVPSGQWSTTNGLPYLVTTTKFYGWYRVTNVMCYDIDNANGLYTLIREEIDTLPEDADV